MQSCRQCRRPTVGDERFCGGCGAALDAAPEAATETAVTGSPPPQQEPRARFVPGTLLRGRYRIVGPLGRGGMGDVYRADDLKLGQPVALKFLPEGLERDADRLDRLVQEVKLARQVSHPNVCRVYDVDEFDGQHFISMEFVDGEDLASLLRRIGRLPPDKAAELARQICAGLAAAHEQGILHRDLKPANVMIDGRGRARIADFGLAGLPETIRGAEILTGTPTYMAPEQLEGRSVSIQSDLYALGLVLYELFTGRPVFQATSRHELLQLQRSTNPVPPTTLVDGIDPAAERAILRCLDPEPAARPRSALEVAASLPGGDPIAAALAAGETPSPDLVAAAGRADAMRRGVAFALATAGVLLFALGGYWRGHYSVRHYLPMEREPAVLVEDAREIIERLGYTGPVYASPLDEAWGYGIWGHRMRALNREATSRAQLRGTFDTAPRAVLDFWYRQSPRRMIPRPRDFGSFAGGPVTRTNPPVDGPGEIFVALDHGGRLNTFIHRPRRYPRVPDAANELDEALLFELAGLNRAAFDPVEPRYREAQSSDARWAFLGPSFRGVESVGLRVEIGMSEGRVDRFTVVPESEAQALAELPLSRRESYDGGSLFAIVLLAIWVGCAFLARSNLRKGRADTRGAFVAASIVMAATLIANVLSAHALWTPAGLSQNFLILGTVTMFGATIALFYLGLEPHARRIWPAMLISWSRWVGSHRRLDEPLVGRSVLAGVVAGAVAAVTIPVATWLRSLASGGVPTLEVGSWSALGGQRFVWSELAQGVGGGLVQGLTYPLMLVAGQLLFRRRWAAVVFAILVGVVLADPFDRTWTGTAVHTGLAGILAAIYIAVVLRHGLVALFVASFVQHISVLARASDWTVWHGQSAWPALVVVTTLAALGYRAATAGHVVAVPEPVPGSAQT